MSDFGGPVREKEIEERGDGDDDLNARGEN